MTSGIPEPLAKVPRILDARASHFAQMSASQLFDSIRRTEGRTLAAEIVVPFPPLVDGVSNPELAAAFGADLLILNFYDTHSPWITGLPDDPPASPYPGYGTSPLAQVAALTGRPVGINLEPAAPEANLPEGRLATPDNARLAVEHGAVCLLITGNPATGVTNRSIYDSLSKVRQAVGDRAIVMSGKMHGAGTWPVLGEDYRPLVTAEDVDAFAGAGCQVMLLPAPGTVPGLTLSQLADLADRAHRKGLLVMTSVGTSQEGADEATIRRIALDAKEAGADIHHIGDAGYHGVAVPENILTYSLAIRGRRHTYRRMASSVLR